MGRKNASGKGALGRESVEVKLTKCGSADVEYCDHVYGGAE